MNKTNPRVPCEEVGWWDAFAGRELIRATSPPVASFHQQRACGAQSQLHGGEAVVAKAEAQSSQHCERGGVLNPCSKSNSS